MPVLPRRTLGLLGVITSLSVVWLVPGCQFDASLNGLDLGGLPDEDQPGIDRDPGTDRRPDVVDLVGDDGPVDLLDAEPDLVDRVDVADLVDVLPDADGGFTCTVPEDCPGADTECRVRTCINRRCGLSLVPSGEVTFTQLLGDCLERQCNGQGGFAQLPDANDIPDDNKECTSDRCIEGLVAHSPLDRGEDCGAQGSVCDGSGNCVECFTDSDCPGVNTECKVKRCLGGVCGFDLATPGTVLEIQVPGDCHRDECDADGDVVTVIDDSDRLDDGNACTVNSCTGGVAGSVPADSGDSCGTNLVCDGSGQCRGCNVAADCPGTDSECRTRTCTSGTCGVTFTDRGTRVQAGQVTGDCRVRQCDGAGNIFTAFDDTDVRVDGNTCTLDVCTNGSPTNPPTGPGVTCNQNSGRVCDGAGACVACVVANDCPGQDTDCRRRTCSNNVCGTMNVGLNTPTTKQVSGDCKTQVCDGQGGTTTMNNDNDRPVDANACTDDVCSSGMPSNPPSAMGTGCNQMGGNFCNGASSCVQCLTAMTCPGEDNDCQSRTCIANRCGFSFVNGGTPLPDKAQTDNDCQVVVCDGAGGTRDDSDNADVPLDDGNPCTGESCMNGMPIHPNLDAGMSCNVNGNTLCNGAGACVQCLTAMTCPGADNECQTRTCVQGSCGFDRPVDGTATATQVPGDCNTRVCNGAGGFRQMVNDSDVGADTNACTIDGCSNGTPTHVLDTAQGTFDQLQPSAAASVLLSSAQTVGQTFIAGATGVLTGVELSLANCTGTTTGSAVLSVRNAGNQVLGSAQLTLANIDCSSGVSRRFDLTAACIAISATSGLSFQLSLTGVPAGACDTGTSFCTAGRVGATCAGDAECEVTLDVGHEPIDAYADGTETLGGTAQAGADLAFRTLVR